MKSRPWHSAPKLLRADQIKRHLRVVLEPAHLGLRLGLMDALPTVRVIRPLSRHSSTRLSLRALVITETDDRLMAAAAIIGDKRSPVTG